MISFVWTAAILGGFLLWRRRHHEVGRLEIALVVALLGTGVAPANSPAEEIFNNPIIFERILRGGLSGLALILVLPRLRKVAQQGSHMGMVLLISYGLLALLSTLWSEAPLVTAAKAFELGVGIAIVVAFAFEGKARIRQAIDFLVLSGIPFLATALIGFLLVPSQFAFTDSRPGFVLEQTMTAPFAHSNGLSATAGLVAVFAFAKLVRGDIRPHFLGAAALGLTVILLSSARQGIVIIVATFALVLVIYRPRLFLFVILPIVLFVGLTTYETISEIVFRGQDAELFGTLSGRVTWWAAALEAWKEHPYMGFGFGAGGRFVALERAGYATFSSLHNGFLEALIGIGLVGFGVLLLLVSMAARYAWRNRRTDLPLLAILAAITLHTAISLGYGAWLGSDFLLLGLMAVGSGLAASKITGPQAEHAQQHRATLQTV